MIIEYYRPKKITEAVEILKKKGLAIPIGGGTSLNRLKEDVIVVDLQDLKLSYIKNSGKRILIGSMTTLEQVKEYFLGNESLQKALKIEGSKNQRIQSSLGGFLKLADGRSPLLTCFLTLGCTVFYVEEEKSIPLNKFLDNRNNDKKLITHISIDNPTELTFETVSRSPLDLPIVCCAVFRLENGLRAAVGGFGETPRIVPADYFTDKNNTDLSKLMQFSTDDWASANYRASIAQIILERLCTPSKKGDQ